MSTPELCPRDSRALQALFAHRDHRTLEVKASQAQLCRASSVSATSWQTYAIPSLVRLGLVQAERVSMGHYQAFRYRLTPLGVQTAKTTPILGADTTPTRHFGVVSGSSRGRTLGSSSFLDYPEEREKEPTKETTPSGEVGAVSGSSADVGEALKKALELIEALVAERGVPIERCECGRLKVKKTNGKTGAEFLACPLWKKCPHYAKAESPAAESARKSREAAEKTRQALQARQRTA